MRPLSCPVFILGNFFQKYTSHIADSLRIACRERQDMEKTVPGFWDVREPASGKRREEIWEI